MTDVTTLREAPVVRPLKKYISLILEQFSLAEKAGMDYYREAGRLLNEVEDVHFKGNRRGFLSWAVESFGKKSETIRTYQNLDSSGDSKRFKSLNDFKRAQGQHVPPSEPGSRIYRDWTKPVNDEAVAARSDAIRAAKQQQDERVAEAKLGLRLIAIGYKVLAQELHPDKMGGSREAMTRLNRVRDRLKGNV